MGQYGGARGERLLWPARPALTEAMDDRARVRGAILRIRIGQLTNQVTQPAGRDVPGIKLFGWAVRGGRTPCEDLGQRDPE